MTEALDRVDGRRGGPGRDHRDRRASPTSRSARRWPTPTTRVRCPLMRVDEPSLSMTIGINTSPLAGPGRQEAHRPPASRPGSTRSSSATCRSACCRHRAARHVGGAGPRRAPARGARRDDASRRVRAHRRQATGRDPTIDGKLHEPMERVAIDVPEDYLGVVTPAPRAAQGPHGADGQPRHRLGPHGLPRARPRPHRVPHRVHDRDARHGPAAPRVRRLRAVARRAAHPPAAARSSPTGAGRRPTTR